MENSASKIIVEDLNIRLEKYAFKEYVDEMRQDFANLAKKEDFAYIADEIDNFKREQGRLCSRDELMIRINVIMTEFNAKLSDRPTIGYMKKLLNAFDEKIVSLNEQLKLHIDLMEHTQKD